jgi:23S rRNA (pseudouridine1915-N3)-methyltransferase
MRIRLLCVGKPRDRVLARVHDRYAERLGRLGPRYESLWVPDEEVTGLGGTERAREREAGRLLARLEARGTVVVLDGRGTAWSSAELAARLERWATPGLTLILGGPHGLHESVRARAGERWSLSALTLPHELARVVVVEQIYRAVTLLRGIPYHR